MNEKHWLTQYDPDDGEPYGVVCNCHIGQDHDGAGNLIDIDEALGINSTDNTDDA